MQKCVRALETRTNFFFLHNGMQIQQWVSAQKYTCVYVCKTINIYNKVGVSKNEKKKKMCARRTRISGTAAAASAAGQKFNRACDRAKRARFDHRVIGI